LLTDRRIYIEQAEYKPALPQTSGEHEEEADPGKGIRLLFC
jgi:hypothetical protein